MPKKSKKKGRTRSVNLSEPSSGRTFAVLFEDCMVHADRNGRVLAKDGTPMTSHLEMEHTDKDLHIRFKAYRAAQGNGSCQVTVKLGTRTVLQGHGGFTAGPNDVRQKTLVPGDWEKRIPHYD